MTPTARSLAYLRKLGYVAGVVERYNAFRKFKSDLFGFVDILAIRNGEMVAVQTTSAPHVASRLTKIRESPHLPVLLSTGCRLEVHGWGKPTKTRRTWSLRIERVLDASVSPCLGLADVAGSAYPDQGWAVPSGTPKRR